MAPTLGRQSAGEAAGLHSPDREDFHCHGQRDHDVLSERVRPPVPGLRMPSDIEQRQMLKSRGYLARVFRSRIDIIKDKHVTSGSGREGCSWRGAGWSVGLTPACMFTYRTLSPSSFPTSPRLYPPYPNGSWLIKGARRESGRWSSRTKTNNAEAGRALHGPTERTNP